VKKMIKQISNLFFLFLLMATYGCATNPTATLTSYLPAYENTCRIYQKYTAQKGERYKCVKVYEDGEKYDGEFIDDYIRDGHGIYYYSSNVRYEGQWENGKRVGNGIEYFPLGDKLSKYEGEFRNDRRNGQGAVYDAQGVVVAAGLFENNIFIPESEIEKRKVFAEQLRQRNEIIDKEVQVWKDEIRIAGQKESERMQREKVDIARAEEERIIREGDGTPDDLLCKKYGLLPQTGGYAECRMRLDFARAESHKKQEQYQAAQAEYEKQVAAIEREREKQRGLRQLELGLRMMGGQRPIDAVNSVGTGMPIAPSRPAPVNQTITMPNGRMINCTTLGTNTNCF
jgi:antitoxin component YwqK of YwqJK toxin-antitoxin module